jgi:protein-disulfide isomerase
LAGGSDAEITIVEYADFQCPACRMAYDQLKPIKDKYKDRIKFFYKNMPLDFHKMAMPSALYLRP